MVQRETVYSPPVSLSKLSEIEAALGEAIRGKPEVVRLSLACLLARGHLLIEDVPGVGKTTLAQALARSVDSSFHRLQFTSDMLPSDVVGRHHLQRAHPGVRVQARAGVHAISCWPTKSIARRRRRNRRCSKP